MGEAMKGVTKAMGQMNRQMNLPSLQRIMQEFERQNEKMELVSEVMGDAIDDALEAEEEEQETEELVNQVLDEIGININQEVHLSFHRLNFLSLLFIYVILSAKVIWEQLNVHVLFQMQLVNAPSAAVSTTAAKNKVAEAELTGNADAGIDDDLQARLDNLRRM